MIDKALETCPLFNDIGIDQLTSLLECLGAKECQYHKDEYVFRRDEPAQYVGIVLSGSVHVVQEDFWGNRAIHAHIKQSELFGESLSSAGLQKLPVSVVAVEDSKIMLLNYKKITTTCPNTCVFHSHLIANMLAILAQKNVMLTQKLEHVSQRSTQEKILSFLSSEAVKANSQEIMIPYNRQELADYLCVDRSALSRELAHMQQSGVLRYDKNRFVLL